MNEKLKYLPVIFQKLKQYDVETIDTRFIKVKIWLQHTGANLNGSFFSKEIIEEAIPTLANTPILCFIEENKLGELDFSDHRMELEKDENGVKVKYLGQAIGIIPETNNATFENRVCDDGVEREFLVCDGLIWTKWDEPLDILSSNSVKGQSMELNDGYEGYFDKTDKLYHFTKFEYFGACILGDDVSPAMQNSTVEVQFANNTMFKDIQNKFQQFKLYCEEGGSSVDKQEIFAKFSYLKGEEFEALKKDEEISVEELQNKLFALSNNQIQSLIREKVSEQKVIKHYWDGEAYETSKYYLTDIIQSENIVILEDNEDYKYYGVPYSMSGDAITLDYANAKRYIRGDWRAFVDGQDTDVVNPMFAQIEEENKTRFTTKLEEVKKSFNVVETEEYKTLQGELETLKTNYTQLEETNTVLAQFKQQIESADRLAKENVLFEEYKELEGREKFELIKTEKDKFTLEDLEEKLVAEYGRYTKEKQPKKNFSKQDNTIKIPVINNHNNDLTEAELRYGTDIKKYL